MLSRLFNPGKLIFAAVLLFADGVELLAQEKPPAEWDTTKPRGATREIDFETSEGTWMSPLGFVVSQTAGGFSWARSSAPPANNRTAARISFPGSDKRLSIGRLSLRPVGHFMKP